jgi:hypothetical protein
LRSSSPPTYSSVSATNLRIRRVGLHLRFWQRPRCRQQSWSGRSSEKRPGCEGQVRIQNRSEMQILHRIDCIICTKTTTISSSAVGATLAHLLCYSRGTTDITQLRRHPQTETGHGGTRPCPVCASMSSAYHWGQSGSGLPSSFS